MLKLDHFIQCGFERVIVYIYELKGGREVVYYCVYYVYYEYNTMLNEMSETIDTMVIGEKKSFVCGAWCWFKKIVLFGCERNNCIFCCGEIDFFLGERFVHKLK